MAKAEARVERVVIETKTVHLELDENEAETLWSVLRKVSGDEALSPRKHTQSIRSALERAGVGRKYAAIPRYVMAEEADKLRELVESNPANLLTGQLIFNTYPKERRRG